MTDEAKTHIKALRKIAGIKVLAKDIRDTCERAADYIEQLEAKHE